MTTIPPTLIPRILALKDYMGECWPYYLDWTGEWWLFGDRVPLADSSPAVYDFLCMACIRTLLREMKAAPNLDESDTWIMLWPQGWVKLPDCEPSDSNLLTNLISAVEWVKARAKPADAGTSSKENTNG